jgi:polyvinyl alcohol dehydrogenase (cytochrome)
MKTKYAFLIPTFMLVISIQSMYLFGQDKKLWLIGGQNLNNTRSADNENKITPQNAASLEVKWAFTTGGDVSATATVDEDAVYFPDWAGNLYKVNAETGVAIWSHPISFYTGIAGDFARVSPAIAGNTLIIGTQLRRSVPGTLDGAHVLAINKITGQLIWKTKVEDFFGAVITQSAVVHRNRIFVGVSSSEEAFATDPNYPCCSFRGSFVCLDLNTGSIVWKTYMTPEGKGFSGCAVWGSTPVIDAKRNSVFISTGNNYTVPQQVLDCAAAGGTPDQVRNCVNAVDGSAENYFDAVVALDLNTGAVKWARPVIPFDAWTVACLFPNPNPNCPENAGPDYDFGQGPALFTVGSGKNKRELLGAGQKSGIYWAFNPDNGETVWSTQVGPGGTLGGLEWGSAVDGERIYTAVANNSFVPHLMTTGPGAGTTVQGGFWAALNAETGSRIWEIAGNNPPATGSFPAGAKAINTGAVSVANGVVFGGAMDAIGTMYAFDASTGQKLWSFESGGSVNSGATIVNGNVYWGSGYANIAGTPNNKLYAFQLGNAANRTTSAGVKNIVNNSGWASIAPNPTINSKLNLMVSGEKGKNIEWNLTSLQGSNLVSGKFNTTSNNHKQELDFGYITPGTYFIQVVSGAKRTTIKVLKVE